MNKALFFRLIMLLSGFAFFSGSFSGLQAQPSCEISIDKSLPVCPMSEFQLSVEEVDGYEYLWKTEAGEEIGNTPSILLRLTEETGIVVRVTDVVNSEECESDPFIISVHTPIEIELLQKPEWRTCTNGDENNGNNAKVRAIASGDFEADEYHYFWKVSPLQIAPGDSALAIGLKAHQKYIVEVRDNYGCPAWDTVWTQAYDNPVVEIFTDPDSIAYIQKPQVTFTFENLSADTIDIINHFWRVEIGNPAYPDSVIESNLPNPIITYDRVGIWPAFLTVYNGQGCDTVYSYNMEIKPVHLFIPNVFTPNGDGANDFFKVALLEGEDNKNTDILLNEYYQSTKLVVFNRWGKVVYESDDYDNKWDGSKLSDGVYYYVLKCQGAKSNDVFKGAVTIVGTGSRQ